MITPTTVDRPPIVASGSSRRRCTRFAEACLSCTADGRRCSSWRWPQPSHRCGRCGRSTSPGVSMDSSIFLDGRSALIDIDTHATVAATAGPVMQRMYQPRLTSPLSNALNFAYRRRPPSSVSRTSNIVDVQQIHVQTRGHFVRLLRGNGSTACVAACGAFRSRQHSRKMSNDTSRHTSSPPCDCRYFRLRIPRGHILRVGEVHHCYTLHDCLVLEIHRRSPAKANTSA